MEGQSSDKATPDWILFSLEIALLVSLIVALGVIAYAIHRHSRRLGYVVAVGLILVAFGVLWAWWAPVSVESGNSEVTCTLSPLSAAFPEVSTADGEDCRDAARSRVLIASGGWVVGVVATGIWLRRRTESSGTA